MNISSPFSFLTDLFSGPEETLKKIVPLNQGKFTYQAKISGQPNHNCSEAEQRNECYFKIPEWLRISCQKSTDSNGCDITFQGTRENPQTFDAETKLLTRKMDPGSLSADDLKMLNILKKSFPSAALLPEREPGLFFDKNRITLTSFVDFAKEANGSFSYEINYANLPRLKERLAIPVEGTYGFVLQGSDEESRLTVSLTGELDQKIKTPASEMHVYKNETHWIAEGPSFLVSPLCASMNTFRPEQTIAGVTSEGLSYCILYPTAEEAMNKTGLPYTSFFSLEGQGLSARLRNLYDKHIGHRELKDIAPYGLGLLLTLSGVGYTYQKVSQLKSTKTSLLQKIVGLAVGTFITMTGVGIIGYRMHKDALRS